MISDEQFERCIDVMLASPSVVSVNVVSGADAVYNRFGQVMDSGGVPTYLTAERAMVCLNEFIRCREWLR